MLWSRGLPHSEDTFNISIIRASVAQDEVPSTARDGFLGGKIIDEVLSTARDNFLGGKIIDEIIADWILKRYANQTGSNEVLKDDLSKIKARKAAKKAKEELSYQESATIKNIKFEDGVFKQTLLRREVFESLCETKVWSKINPVIDEALESASDKRALKPDDVDIVVMIGGSTRIPKVQELLRRKFDGGEWGKRLKDETTKVRFVDNPDEAVAIRAAIHAFLLMPMIIDHRFIQAVIDRDRSSPSDAVNAHSAPLFARAEAECRITSDSRL